MSIDSFGKTIKWWVYSFGLLIGVAMLFMGPFDFTSNQITSYVGKVDGEVISLESFRQELTNRQENIRRQGGDVPQGLNLVTMRVKLFEDNIQRILLRKLTDNYSLATTPEEMWDHLEANPFPAAMQDTLFQTNGAFDPVKYTAWLHDSNTIRNFLAGYEGELKNIVIPSQQLQQLSRSQLHTTTLEKAYADYAKAKKAKFVYYYAPFDSFSVKDSITEEELLAYYESAPDSFNTSEESVRLGYLKAELKPSKDDSILIYNYIDSMRYQINSLEDFEEIAVTYSEDDASAENGGSLGGLQTRDAWVKEFSDVAFSLDTGEVSKPVLTEFGYHIIRCNKIEIKDSVETRDLSHILRKIETTTETIAEMEDVLKVIRQKAVDEERTLKSISDSSDFPYSLTKVIYRGDYAPFGNFQYVNGIHSFAFSGSQEESISNVLQSDNGVYVFEKIGNYPKGRNFDREKDRIRELVEKEKKINLAKASFESLIKSINADEMPKNLGMAVLDSTNLISTNSWVNGIGYNSPALHKVFSQEINKWSNSIETDFGVIIAKVIEKETPDIKEFIQAAESENKKSDPTRLSQIYMAWIDNLRKSQEVENNLDLIYSN